MGEGCGVKRPQDANSLETLASPPSVGNGWAFSWNSCVSQLHWRSCAYFGLWVSTPTTIITRNAKTINHDVSDAIFGG